DAERRAVDLEDKIAGRDPARIDATEGVRVLFADVDDRLFKAVEKGAGPGLSFTLAQTGGEALGFASTPAYHLALFGPTLPDLPSTMVMRTMKSSSPELTVVAYQPGVRLEIIEASRTIPLVDQFTSVMQLLDRLPDLAEAHRIKLRERRYL